VNYLGALVLVPQMLQLEMNYPVLTAGLATTPRGLGMAFAIIVISRLRGRVNIRPLIAAGLSINAIALYMMSHWSLTVGMREIVWTGALQGFGLGFIMLPVSNLAFSTLAPELRTDGSAFFSLLRNVGGSVGIAIVATRVVEVTQVQHGHLAGYLTPFHALPVPPHLPIAAALRMLNLGITRQAGMVAYINAYYLLGALSVLMLPLVMFLRIPKPGEVPAPAVAIAD
jgi:DHA2 family multidrug resistance protein